MSLRALGFTYAFTLPSPSPSPAGSSPPSRSLPVRCHVCAQASLPSPSLPSPLPLPPDPTSHAPSLLSPTSPLPPPLTPPLPSPLTPPSPSTHTHARSLRSQALAHTSMDFLAAHISTMPPHLAAHFATHLYAQFDKLGQILPGHDTLWWYLAFLATHPDAKGSGVGSALLAHQTKRAGLTPLKAKASQANGFVNGSTSEANGTANSANGVANGSATSTTAAPSASAIANGADSAAAGVPQGVPMALSTGTDSNEAFYAARGWANRGHISAPFADGSPWVERLMTFPGDAEIGAEAAA